MVVPLIVLTLICLLLSPDPTDAEAVNILNPGEVVYDDVQVYGVVNMAVILECGSTLPDIYIWGFTKQGTDKIKAVVYNFGHGPRMQALAATLGSVAVISHSASLSIDQLPRASEGLYTCQAFYERPEGPEFRYYYVRLTVRVPVSKPYVLLSDASPVEGSVVVLRCGLGNGTSPILYEWEHERPGTPVTTIARGNSSMLIMSNVNRNNTGWYRCVVSNAVNLERSDRALMDVVYGPDIPQIDVTPYSLTEKGYSALERERVLLMCQAQSNPPSVYTWYYNNSQVNGGPSFIINKILRSHTGKYACRAQNTQLDTSSIKSINLTVFSDPPFGAYPAVIGAAIGGMIVAAILTLLILLFLLRNRNSRLRDMLFGMQHGQSRENINFPDDELADGDDLGSSPVPAISLPRAASPIPTSPAPEQDSPTNSQAPPTGDDKPVNVTITVKATGS